MILQDGYTQKNNKHWWWCRNSSHTASGNVKMRQSLWKTVCSFSKSQLFHSMKCNKNSITWERPDETEKENARPLSARWRWMIPNINTSYSIAHGSLLSATWQPGWEGSLGKNGYMCICDWVLSLFTWNTTLLISCNPIQNKKFKIK